MRNQIASGKSKVLSGKSKNIFCSSMNSCSKKKIADDILKYASERKILYEVSRTIIDSGDLIHHSNAWSLGEAYEFACKKMNVEPLNTSFINKNECMQTQWVKMHDSLIHEAYIAKAEDCFKNLKLSVPTGHSTHGDILVNSTPVTVVWKGAESFPGQQEQLFHMMEARKARKEKQVSLNAVCTYMEGYNKRKLAFRQWVAFFFKICLTSYNDHVTSP